MYLFEVFTSLEELFETAEKRTRQRHAAKRLKKVNQVYVDLKRDKSPAAAALATACTVNSGRGCRSCLEVVVHVDWSGQRSS